MTATCTKCRARQYAGETGWTRNGNGWLCERHSPNGQPVVEVNEEQEEDHDQVEDHVHGYDPMAAPSSSSSSSSTSDVPSLVDWLIAEHKAGRQEPLPVGLLNSSNLPSGADRVARFIELVCGLRDAVDFKRGEPVPFGCKWVGEHVGLSDTAVWNSLRMLEARGAIKKGEPLPWREGYGKGKNRVDTYLPGDGAA